MQKKSHEVWWETNLGNEYYTHHNTLVPAPSIEEFESWMGDHNAIDRIKARELLVEYNNILDAGCGAAPESKVVNKDKYFSIDITPKLVDYNISRGINCKQGSLMDIPYEDNFFDVVISRHVVEHMSEIEKPLAELIRVAKKQVLLYFFIDPVLFGPHDIVLDNKGTTGELYHNTYSKHKIDEALNTINKVHSYEWVVGAGKTKVFLSIMLGK